MRRASIALALSSVAAWALFLGILSGRAELLVVAAPLIIALVSLRSHSEPIAYQIGHAASTTHLLEGERLKIAVTIRAMTSIPVIEILDPLSPLVEMARGCNRTIFTLRPGQELTWTYEVRCSRRGQLEFGDLRVRVWDASGIHIAELHHKRPVVVRVYPRLLPLRRLPLAIRTRASFGNYVAPRLGEGLEPGEIRPFVPGDRARHINWRASLRQRQLFVTQFHEDRNADIVLLLDTLADTGTRPGSSLDCCVRATAGLASAYLARKDRVGLIEYGGWCRFIRPGSGRRQYERILEALVPADLIFTYVSRDLTLLPSQVLPPQALVLAISPLIDKRFINVVVDLAARGFDVVVLAVSPIEPTRPALLPGPTADLARRLWSVEWETRVQELRQRGPKVLVWRPAEPLDSVFAQYARHRPRLVLAR